MRLTKLEVHGFKSFADRTELGFQPGVTAIVGPNGCGKSNISDAVRWVLGEQRPRALRGAKMEEVIFQGSAGRRAVNIAEVSLHFDNTDGALPIAFREVVITRRLSRSGESDYLLNDSPCRLRDIHDLVRGTGLGAEAGVIIEARMIDALLSDRPDERRALFEEAAGIGLYRDRRRSTERRLEETTADLSRLDDLIGEVQTQVRSLARQRKRAERHVELSARRRTIEIALASREMAAWADELQSLEGRVEALRASAPAAEGEVVTAERARDAAHAARAAGDGRRADAGREVSTLREAVLQLQGELAVAEERRRNTLARRQRAEEERSGGEGRDVRLAEDRQRAEAEHGDLLRQAETARAAVDAHASAEAGARQTVTAARVSQEKAERAAQDLRARLGQLSHSSEAARREVQDLAGRLETLAHERDSLLDAQTGLRRERERAHDSLAGAQTATAAADAALARALEETHVARRHETDARSEFMLAEEAHTSVSGTVSAVEGLERERVGLAPAAGRLLRERDTFGAGAILGPLSDFLTTDASHAAVIERYLGATVHAVLVRDRAVADAVRAWHHSTNPGPLLLLPLDGVLTAAAVVAKDSLAGLVHAADVASAWVTALLGEARPLEDGAAFTDSRGAVWLPGPAGGAGPLRRRAELSALRTSLGEAAGRRERAVASLDAARQRAEIATAAMTTAQDQAGAASAEARRAAEWVADAERRLERADRETAEADSMRARFESRRDTLAATLDDIRRDTERLTESLADHDRAVSDARAAVLAAEAAAEETRDRRSREQVAQAQVVARLEVAADRVRRLSEEYGSATARMAMLDNELAELGSADEALRQHMAARQADFELRRGALAVAEAVLAETERAARVVEEEADRADRALDAARHRGTAVSESLHHAELRLTELSGRRTAIRERMEAEWRKPLADLLAEAEPLEVDDAALRAEADDLRAQLDALGPVNPLAIEEHTEEQKRAEFLATQRADLAGAHQSLHQALREIDITARAMFLTTFTTVQEHFRRIFLTLFGGGECDLRLENPELPLDCDIEIHASPRGKRTQRIHLLSSGERALVALALLFGIFLAKPSPFCLLDEVDAPLDDQNIGRFVRMLTEFKGHTQFIVITHNPRTTVEAADAVYGVTMQEPGVSSIVSVRLRERAIEEAIAGRIQSKEAAAAPV